MRKDVMWKLGVVIVLAAAIIVVVQAKTGRSQAPSPEQSVAAVPAPPPPEASVQPTPAESPEGPPEATGGTPAAPAPSAPAPAPKPKGEETRPVLGPEPLPSAPKPPAAPKPVNDEPKPTPEPAAKKPQRLPRLLDLGMGMCIPCKMMVPILDSLKQEYAGKLIVEVIDLSHDQSPAEKYGIQSIPTQIIFDREGKEVFRHIGFWSKEDILAKLRELGLLD